MINKHWEEIHISEVLKIRNEKILNDKKIPHFSLSISDGITPKKKRYERDFLVKDENQKKYKVVYPDDIVFNPPNIRFGAIARSKLDFKVIVSPSYEVFYTNLNKFCPIFLEHLLCSEYMMKKYLKFVQGTLVERTSLDTSDFLNLKLKIPKLTEQKKIGEKLSNLTDLINSIYLKIRRLDYLQKSLIKFFLTKGLKNEEIKETDVGFIPSSWQIKKIKQILKLGYGKSPNGVKKQNGQYPVYGTGEFIEKSNEFLYDGESIILGRKGSIDQVTYVDGKFWAIDTTFYAHSFKEVLPKFVYYFFKNLNLNIYNESTSIPSLSRDTVYSISIGLPDLSEQKKIIKILSNVEKLQIKQIQKLDKILFLKKSFENTIYKFK